MVNTSINCLSMWMLATREGGPPLPLTVGFLLNTLRWGWEGSMETLLTVLSHWERCFSFLWLWSDPCPPMLSDPCVNLVWILCSMIFGVGALLAPQLVHYMEVWTGSGTGVFYVAFTLASSMAVTTLLLPKGAVPPLALKVPSSGDENLSSLSQLGVDGGEDGMLSAGVEAGVEAGSEVQEAAAALKPIIWDEGGNNSDASDEGDDGGRPQMRGGKWRLPFQAALLSLIFSNVAIELGECP